MLHASSRFIRVVNVLFATLVFSLAPAFAAEDAGALQKANNDVSNIASLQRGARNFLNYCMGCHSAQYVRYNRLPRDLGITEDQLINNLMFAAKKPHDTMQTAMPMADAQRWFGQAPPDLTLVARNRGTDWIYSFLKSFYIDETAPAGINNLVLENASMPHVLWELQGMQRAVYEEEPVPGGEPRLVFVEFEQVTPGQLSAEEYDEFVRDTVNFLEYIGEPVQLERRRLGIWVLAFLFVFGLFAYLLNKEMWRDIKK